MKVKVEFERKPFYSPREFAAIAGIDPSTVLDHIHAGKLYAVKVSDRIYRIPLGTVMTKLHPELVGEPRFRKSRNPEARARKYRELIRAEQRAWRAAAKARASASRRA